MNRFAREWKRLRRMLGTDGTPTARTSRRLRLEYLEARLAPAGGLPANIDFAHAQDLTGTPVVHGTYAAGATEYYSFTAAETGRLTTTLATTQGQTPPRLILYGSSQQLLIQSDGANGGAAKFAQHLKPGTYYLAVSLIGNAVPTDPTFELDTAFDAAVPPFQGLPVGSGSFSEATGDFNHDGNLDLVTANEYGFSVSVALGRGDGTFQTPVAYQVPDLGGRGSFPAGVAVGDFNHDGNLDIVTSNFVDHSMTVLLGNGDGTFRTGVTVDVPNGASAVAVGDFRGDGKLDVVITNPGSGTVSVFLGNGDGTFQAPVTYAVDGSASVAVGDFNGDGKLDLVISDSLTGFGVSVMLGNGDGTFRTPVSYGTGPHPSQVVVADVNGDGKPDLVTANSGNDTVSVLMGKGDGTFQAAVDYASGSGTLSVALADFNRDGRLDIVASDNTDTTVSVLLGREDGTFSSPANYPVGNGQNTHPYEVAVGDFNRDGDPDIASVNQDSTVTLLRGRGDGTFVASTVYSVGHQPTSVAVGDFNRDGNADAVVANYADGTISVLLGNGNGTFLPGATYTVGTLPDFVAVGDLNGDGSRDLVVINRRDHSLSVLLGRGDGTFLAAVNYAVGDNPYSVVVDDFDKNGSLDIICANGDGTVSVLLGRGDGTFLPQRTYQVGPTPLSLTAVKAADLNHDGKLDLVVGNDTFANGKVAVMLGNGDGTFQDPVFYDGGVNYATDVAVADFNHDGILDIVDVTSGEIALGNGDGTFQRFKYFYNGISIGSVAVADFNHDGNLDIASSSYGPVEVSLGRANGPLGIDDPRIDFPVSYPVGTYANSVAVGDFNNDGIPDIVNTNYTDRTVSVLLGRGDGTFRLAASANANRNVPLLQDLTGDGVADTVVLDSSGDILFRRGLPGGTNHFAPPVIINPGHFAHDITLYRTATGWAVAAIEAGDKVSRYLYDPATGSFARKISFATRSLPLRIAAADLTGDGLDDLVVANEYDNVVTIGLQNFSGSFHIIAGTVGVLPSDITFADLGNPDGPDIVVSDQVSGDFSVLRNDSGHTFAHQDRYRAGTGLFGIDDSTGIQTVSSTLQTVALVAGHFTAAGHDDLAVLNRGADSFTLLPTQAGGTFTDPSPSSTYFTSPQPTQVVALTLPGDSLSSVAVLMQDLGQIWIYRNPGNGPLAAPLKIDAGNAPTGFSVATVKGKPALLIGNKYGDILTLVYDGQTFAPDRADLNNLPLAVGTLAGSGRQYAVVADQQHDKVFLYYRLPGSNRFGPGIPITGTDQLPLLAPGAVQVFEVPGDADPYLVVANSLSNDVLVYHYDPLADQFAFLTSAAVGFNPVSVTVADINGDKVPDLLVANQGSNDVSILVGNTAGGTWAATAYQRLASGGSGPVGVTVGDFTGRGLPDLRVANGDGSVATLPGIGSGGKGSAFFQPPATVPALGGAITDAVFDPTTGREFVVSGGRLSVFDGTAFTAIATPGFVTTLGVVGGLLVAGFADHTVGVLTEEGTLLERSEPFADQPSALQALQDGNAIDIYLTVDGSQVPVFISLLIPVLTELPASPAVTQATTIAGGELVLVATLLSGGLFEGTQQDALAAEAGGQSFVLFLPQVAIGVTGAVPGQVAEEAGPGQAAENEVAVALVVRADLDGLPPTAEFRSRVQEALRERMATKQVFDSVEDLVETIKQVLDQFRPTPEDDEPAAFRGDLEFVALDRVAEAVMGNGEQEGYAFCGAESSRTSEPAEGESLLSLQFAFLVSWLGRPPAETARRRTRRFATGAV